MGRLENALGWYHSHPGYGCWLSGIDVDTQMTNQKYQEPFVAIVVSRRVSCDTHVTDYSTRSILLGLCHLVRLILEPSGHIPKYGARLSY